VPALQSGHTTALFPLKLASSDALKESSSTRFDRRPAAASAMMLRLFVAATVWPALVDSSANADAISFQLARRSRFPVQMEADTGDPKPGEGLGGVAVLLKPMPEATTMKTWSFLKESMLKIGDQVRQIMQVRNDMSMLQQDLSDQEKLWHQAEIELKQENAKLRGNVEELKRKVKVGSKVKGELMKVKQSVEEEKRRATDLDNEEDMQEKKWQLELEFLRNRKNNVTALHQQVNETASLEISRAEAVHLQLQKDAVTLRLALGSMQDQVKNGQEKMQFEQSKALAEHAELQRQIAAMQQGLKRIQGKLKPKHFYDGAELELKQGLQKETDTILNLQAEHQQVVARCDEEMKEQDAIKCSENGKLSSRLAEKSQFCNAIQVQNEVLKQDLAKCSLLSGVGARPQAPVMPPGLVPAVAMRDEERFMTRATAPAPAPMAYL